MRMRLFCCRAVQWGAQGVLLLVLLSIAISSQFTFLRLASPLQTSTERIDVLPALESVQRDNGIQHKTVTEPKDKRPCRVVLENKMDYHYEVIESAALRFPLPWDDYNCTISREEPVIVDFALAQNMRMPRSKSELPGWERYHGERMHNRVVRRPVDGVYVRYGDIVDYKNYLHAYDAFIGVSCDSYRFKKWMKGEKNTYCVLHGTCEPCDEDMYNRSCFLSPMHSPRCYFIPSDLPQFEDASHETPATSANKTFAKLCVVGGEAKRVHMLAAGLAQSSLQHAVRINLHQRSEEPPHPFYAYNVTHLVNVIRINDYLAFQRSISHCDALLPLTTPETTPRYFGGEKGLKKSSGSMAQGIGYRLPMLVHEEVDRSYGKHFTAPAEVYNDTASFVVGLERLVSSLVAGTETT